MKDESLNKNPQLGFLNNIEWINAPASEIFISVNDRNHPELPVLSASQEWGMIYRDEGGMNIFHDVANEITYKLVRPGQFVIHLRSFQGGFAHSKVEGITSPAYTILDFKDKNKHNDLFWKYVLTSDEFIKRLELITYGIRDGRSINYSDFSTLKFYFPSHDVQQKIGTFISHVDSLIQTKTKKLESLKAVKKSLLQKCFPKAGEKVPEMRFAGFSGDWEESQLSELLEVSNLHNRDDKFRKEDIYSVSREFGVINQIEYQGKSLAGASLVNYKVVKRGNVVYTKSPLAEQPYGIIKANKNKDGIVSTLYGVYKEKDNCDSNFIQIYFDDNNRLNDYLRPLINKGAKNTILVSDEDALSGLIKYPSKPEQQKIGQFFSKYDSLISAQQKEIDKLKYIKKSLLQKMFI